MHYFITRLPSFRCRLAVVCGQLELYSHHFWRFLPSLFKQKVSVRVAKKLHDYRTRAVSSTRNCGHRWRVCCRERRKPLRNILCQVEQRMLAPSILSLSGKRAGCPFWLGLSSPQFYLKETADVHLFGRHALEVVKHLSAVFISSVYRERVACMLLRCFSNLLFRASDFSLASLKYFAVSSSIVLARAVFSMPSSLVTLLMAACLTAVSFLVLHIGKCSEQRSEGLMSAYV